MRRMFVLGSLAADRAAAGCVCWTRQQAPGLCGQQQDCLALLVWLGCMLSATPIDKTHFIYQPLVRLLWLLAYATYVFNMLLLACLLACHTQARHLFSSTEAGAGGVHPRVKGVPVLVH